MLCLKRAQILLDANKTNLQLEKVAVNNVLPFKAT